MNECFRSIVKMTQLSFQRVDFRNSFAACLFIPLHSFLSGADVVVFYFLPIWCFCLAEISAIVQNPVVLVQKMGFL